jgi:hypothetical protein
MCEVFSISPANRGTPDRLPLAAAPWQATQVEKAGGADPPVRVEDCAEQSPPALINIRSVSTLRQDVKLGDIGLLSIIFSSVSAAFPSSSAEADWTGCQTE